MTALRRISLLLAGRPAGQAMAQFAVTATVFLLVTFSIMEMALAVNAYNSISTAAREAARYAIVHSPSSTNSPCPATGSCSAVQAQAVNYAPFLSTGDVSATFTCEAAGTCAAANGAASDYAVVVITHTYPLNIPFTSGVNLSLSASSRMLVSQ